MRLHQTLGFAGEHPAGEMGDEAAGEQVRCPLGDPGTARDLDMRMPQSLGNSLEAALVEESSGARSGQGIDQQEARELGVGGEGVEAGPKTGREARSPVSLRLERRDDVGRESIDAGLIGGGKALVVKTPCGQIADCLSVIHEIQSRSETRPSGNTNIRFPSCQDTHVVLVI